MKMDKAKKRHNPPILEEDSSVQAFDRNDDSVKDSLENKLDASKVEIVKTEDVVRREMTRKVCDLINEVFGSKNYSFNITKNVNEDCSLLEVLYSLDSQITEEISVPINEHNLSLSESVRLSIFNKPKWYQITKSTILQVQLEVDLPDREAESDLGMTMVQSTFLQNDKHSPIKVYVRDTGSLSKAKLFAQKYQELTGKKATVIQDCQDEEIPKTEETKTNPSIEEKVERLESKMRNYQVFSALSAGSYCICFNELLKKDWYLGASFAAIGFSLSVIGVDLKNRAVKEYEAELKKLSEKNLGGYYGPI